MLLACKTVPIARRLAYGFLARMGFRKSECLGGEDEERDEEDGGPVPPLTWDRIDTVRGIVFRGRSKTEKPTPIPLDPGVARALAAWKKLRPPAKPTSPVFVDAAGVVIDFSAEQFREDLTTAGVKRTELHTRTKDNASVRVHDLRALFVTTALAGGRSDTWVRDRTSHRTVTMLERYRRQGRMFEELDLGTLTSLDVAIPELAVFGAARDEGPKPFGAPSDVNAKEPESAPSVVDMVEETAPSAVLAARSKPFDSSYEGSNPSVGTLFFTRGQRPDGTRLPARYCSMQ